MKKLLASALFAFLIVPTFASASVNITSVTVTPDPVEEGQTVTVAVEGVKSGSGCNNNWGYTKYFVDSVQVGTSTLNSFSGTGTTTDSFDFTASGVGSHTWSVEVWSGEEDFNNGGQSPDCYDTPLFNDSGSFTVEEVPSSGGSSSSGSTISGGGGMSPCYIYQKLFNSQCTQEFLDAWIFNQNFHQTMLLVWGIVGSHL